MASGSELFGREAKIADEDMRSLGFPVARHRGGAPGFLKFLLIVYGLRWHVTFD